MEELITYRERVYLDNYRCIDYERKCIMRRSWIVGGLLYGYINQFNVKSIALEDIISREKIN